MYAKPELLNCTHSTKHRISQRVRLVIHAHCDNWARGIEFMSNADAKRRAETGCVQRNTKYYGKSRLDQKIMDNEYNLVHYPGTCN